MKEDCLQQILDLVRPTFRDKLRPPKKWGQGGRSGREGAEDLMVRHLPHAKPVLESNIHTVHHHSRWFTYILK